MIRALALAVAAFATFGSAAPAAAGEGGAPALGPAVTIARTEEFDSFPSSYPVVDALDPSTVLRVRATGFGWFAVAWARQCVTTDVVRCGNSIPIQFSEDGTATFQYFVTDDFLATGPVPGECRAGRAACSIIIEETDGSGYAELLTVFVDTLPAPGRVTVTPRTGITDGQRVVVEVEGYPPNTTVLARLCAPPDATAAARCGAPGPSAPLTVGADGTGRTQLTITAGSVGTEGIQCDRRNPCGVSVASDSVFARAPVVPIAFAAPPGADYDSNQVAIGIAIAALLLGIATYMLRRTDWSPVGEQAAPEIDDAEYADLDAIIAALPPEDDDEDEDVVPAR